MVSAAGDQNHCGRHGPLAQLGERQVRNLEARGSIPLWSTKLLKNAGFKACIFLFFLRSAVRAYA